MIDLAEHNNGEWIPLKDIAARQEVSEKYLESILSILSKAGLVIGARGKGGGYRLAKAPEQYTADSILKLTDGSLAPVACLKQTPNRCPRAARCKTLPMWEKLDGLINGFLEGVTVADLAKGKLE
jgi:Rrf2 family protein